ncbi:MAG: PKD domain-containing protein, partial [Halobacteriota archaeon]
AVLLLSTAGVVTVTAAGASTDATVVNFDEPGWGDGYMVPADYAGLYWHGYWKVMPSDFGWWNSHSPPNAVGAFFEERSVSFPHPVTFVGAYFSGADQFDQKTVQFKGYLDDKFVDESTVLTLHPTPTFLAAEFSGPVNKVVVVPNCENSAINFAMDDLTYIANTAPTLNPLTPAAQTVAVNRQVTISSTFTDPDAGQTHTAAFDWGDGSGTSAGTVDEATGTVTGTHTYTTANDYMVACTVSDNMGGTSARMIATVRVVSQQTVLAEVTALSGKLAKSDFKTANNYNAYMNKMSALASAIKGGSYAAAQIKVTTDLQPSATQWVKPSTPTERMVYGRLALIASDLAALQAT